MNNEEKEKIKKILDEIYKIEEKYTNHCIKLIDGTYQTVVDNEEYNKTAGKALWDIMLEIEKIVDIVK